MEDDDDYADEAAELDDLPDDDVEPQAEACGEDIPVVTP